MRFNLIFKIFFLLIVINGCTSNTNYNEEDIHIDRDDYMSKFDLKFVYVLSYLKEIKKLEMEK